MASNNEQFYKRLREMSGIKPVTESKNETNTKTLVDFERANNGTVYGIVKENHHYFIKKALIKEGNVGVTDFTYIDGVENKGKYQYNSLAEAEKQRNFYLRGINEAWDQGGVYFVNESKETETPSLETKEDFSALVRRTISEGKKNIVEGREKKFKSTLPKTNKSNETKTGLMPEAANLAVKKALGLVSEEAMVTADSEIKDGDIMPDKKGKEKPQAPINDSNAKAKAEKATATGKKDANKKPDSSKSIAVNQADKVLKEEASPLVTDDSEINSADNMADKVNQKHEPSQAPINDTNAKAEADKAMGSGNPSAAIQNNVEESPESEPFDDKENVGDEKGDIVTENHNHKNGEPFKENTKNSGDIVAQDSDQADGDRVDNKTSHEKEEAPYNNHNQPNKGHKEEKGEALKDTAKEKVIGEGEDLITKDSEIKDGDKIVNKTKTNLPKKTGKSEITADSNLNAKDTLANKTTTNLPDAIAEDYESALDTNFDLDDEEDDDFDFEEIENPKAISAAKKDMDEGESLIIKDSEVDAKESIAHQDTGGNVDYKLGNLVQGTSTAMDDNAIAEDEEVDSKLDDAAAALDNLDVATDTEEKEEEKAEDDVETMDLGTEGGEEMDLGAEGGEEMDLGAEGGEEMDLGAEGGEEMDLGAEEGDKDLDVEEIEKLNGKLNQKIRTTELEPDFAKGMLKSAISAFKDKEIDDKDRKEMADDLLHPQKTQSDGGDEMDLGGEEEFDAVEPMDDTVEEDTAMIINGEETDLENGDELPEPSDECPFASYAKERGYEGDSLKECSDGEKASVMSGFASENENIGDSDLKEMGKYMTDGVSVELAEYGHDDLGDRVKPFIEEDGVDFGVSEPTIVGMDLPEDDEEIEDVPEDGVEIELDEPEIEIPEPEVEIETPEPGFANDIEIMGAGMPRPDNGLGTKTKSVEVDVNAGTVKLEVTEAEDKVRKYVKNRLNELAGKKKININENKKSKNIKKLDKLIEQQWKLMGENVKKK